MFSVPTWVHVVPLAELDAVKLPAMSRSIFTQYGASTSAVVVSVLTSSVMTRRWKETPCAGVTTIVACAEPGSRLSRIITPALAQSLVF